MNKKFFIPLLGILTALSISSCSFLDFLYNFEVDVPASLEKYGDSEEPYLSPDEYELQEGYKTYNDLSKQKIHDVSFSPSLGNVNVLVVPMLFSDTYMSEVEKEAILSDLNICFNDKEGKTGWESVSSYFEKSSYGNLNLSFTVADKWFTYNKSKSYMAAKEKGGEHSSDAAIAAFDWYKSTYHSDGSEFDSDSDGNVDTIIIIYGENNYSTDSRFNKGKTDKANSNLWAYTYWANQGHKEVSPEKPEIDTYIFASYDFMYYKKRIDKFPLSTTLYGYGSEYIDVDAHTYIHEFGHCMGLKDYYNYDSDSKCGFAGGFDMQDANVGDHNGYSKFALGWIKPYVVNGNCEITLSPSAINKDQYILIPAKGFNYWNRSPFDEYVLLEFYSPFGLNEFDANHRTYERYPVGPRTYGIKAYHIDARLYGFNIDSRNDLEPVENVGYTDFPNNENYFFDVAAENTTKGNKDYSSRVAECNEFGYSLVHVLSASGYDRMKEGYDFSSLDIFTKYNTFSKYKYGSLFPHEGYMNEKVDGKYNVNLGYNFTVTKLNSETCTIKISEY